VNYYCDIIDNICKDIKNQDNLNLVDNTCIELVKIKNCSLDNVNGNYEGGILNSFDQCIHDAENNECIVSNVSLSDYNPLNHSFNAVNDNCSIALELNLEGHNTHTGHCDIVSFCDSISDSVPINEDGVNKAGRSDVCSGDVFTSYTICESSFINDNGCFDYVKSSFNSFSTDYCVDYFKNYLNTGVVNDILQFSSAKQNICDLNVYSVTPCLYTYDMSFVDDFVHSFEHGVCFKQGCIHPLCFNRQGFSELDFNVDDILTYIKFKKLKQCVYKCSICSSKYFSNIYSLHSSFGYFPSNSLFISSKQHSGLTINPDVR
jgi:hypothetical protein